MLTYMALDWDHQSYRAAKLKALQAFYGTTEAKAFAMLAADAMSPANKDRGPDLVINSHGNAQVFGGYDPAAFLTQLQGKGFQNGSFKAIYLLACKVGEASQDNSIVTNFARDLKLALTGAGIDVKLYAPRGTLDYDIVEETRLGQTVPVVTRIFIDTPERQYPLSEGMLLVQ